MRPYPYIMDLSKAIQAMAYLLKQADDNKYSLVGILRMLYRADIRSFEETAYPILRAGGELVDIVNGRYEPNNGSWQKYIQRTGEGGPKTKLVLVDDPGIGELCQYELDLLEEVFREVDSDG